MIISRRRGDPAALRDHWEDVTTAMHDDDARRLYVEVSEPLDERASLDDPSDRRLATAEGRRRSTFRAQAPTSAARSLSEAEGELERAALRLSRDRGRVRAPRRGRARPATSPRRHLLDDAGLECPDGRARRGSARAEAPLFAEAPLAEGFVSPDLKLAVIPYRRLVHRRRAAAAAPARGRWRLQRPARRRPRRPRGPRDRPLRRLRDEDRRRRDPRLPLARVPRRRPRLRPRGPARQDHPLRRRRRRGAAALGARRSSAGTDLKARARRAARELAGELLNLYAERRARSGHAFPPDGEWQLDARALVPVPRDRRTSSTRSTR